VLLALTVVFSMFPVILAGIPQNGEYLFAKVTLVLGDVPALVLAVVAAPLVLRTIRRGRATALWTALVAVEALALVVHPSFEGVRTVLRLVTTLAIIATVSSLRDRSQRTLVVGVIAILAAFETVIAILQVHNGAPLGLDWLGESQDKLVIRGEHNEVITPEGTVLQGHLLASFALLTSNVIAGHLIRTGPARLWALATAIAVAPAGFTYARAAFAGWVAACVALARGAALGRPRQRIALAALVVGFVVPAIIGLPGWTMRAEEGAGVSKRDELVSQAFALIAEQPLTGVGPGRELIALRELGARHPDELTQLNAVHSVPLTVTVETGVVGGTIFVMLLAVVGYRALRAGGPALALYLGYIPFILLDHFSFTHQHGLVLTGLWLGFIEVFAERDAG
jgi:hypothetical protein